MLKTSLKTVATLTAAVLVTAGIASNAAAQGRMSCSNNLKQIGLGLHTHHDQYGGYGNDLLVGGATGDGATADGDAECASTDDSSASEPVVGSAPAPSRSHADTTLGDVVVVRELDKSTTK